MKVKVRNLKIVCVATLSQKPIGFEKGKTMKVKINLETMSDVTEFVAIASQVEEPVLLTCSDFRVSAKSLLGAIYTMEWGEVWCECSRDIYHRIHQFVV